MAFVSLPLKGDAGGAQGRWCDRPAVCLLGLPFDAVSMAEAVAEVEAAIASRHSCFLSTPNLNFLIAAAGNAAFRESVINSDLSVADGMPLVWIARLLGLPIRERVAGSGLFERLRSQPGPKVSVFFFGGLPGVAAEAQQKLAAENGRLVCVGTHDPGFVAVAEMSADEVIAKINASGADFLVVALGAQKGQAWIEHNRARLKVPVMSHLGAVVNFVAGTVSRAPLWVQRSGLEWLWRIKEEPALWRRYWGDGCALLNLLAKRVIPYAIYLRGARATNVRTSAEPEVRLEELAGGSSRLHLGGAWSGQALPALRDLLAQQLDAGCRQIELSFKGATYIDSAFLGLLLLLRKELNASGGQLTLLDINPELRRIFYWNCVDYLLCDSPCIVPAR